MAQLLILLYQIILPEHLLNLLTHFNQNPAKQTTTNEFLDIISEIISNAEETNEFELDLESEDSKEFEFESPLTSPDLYEEATAKVAELKIPAFVHRKSAFKKFDKTKEDEKNPAEFPIATFGKEGSAFKTVNKKNKDTSSSNNSSPTEDEKRIATI